MKRIILVVAVAVLLMSHRSVGAQHALMHPEPSGLALIFYAPHALTGQLADVVGANGAAGASLASRNPASSAARHCRRHNELAAICQQFADVGYFFGPPRDIPGKIQYYDPSTYKSVPWCDLSATFSLENDGRVATSGADGGDLIAITAASAPMPVETVLSKLSHLFDQEITPIRDGLNGAQTATIWFEHVKGYKIPDVEVAYGQIRAPDDGCLTSISEYFERPDSQTSSDSEESYIPKHNKTIVLFSAVAKPKTIYVEFSDDAELSSLADPATLQNLFGFIPGVQPSFDERANRLRISAPMFDVANCSRANCLQQEPPFVAYKYMWVTQWSPDSNLRSSGGDTTVYLSLEEGDIDLLSPLMDDAEPND